MKNNSWRRVFRLEFNGLYPDYCCRYWQMSYSKHPVPCSNEQPFSRYKPSLKHWASAGLTVHSGFGSLYLLLYFAQESGYFSF